MDKKILTAALLSIAAANVDGFTVSAKTLQPITKGYAVAVAETQNSFGSVGLDRVISYIQENENINAFGGWYNSENGQFYFDATIIVDDLATAMELGRKNGQLAIFDLETLTEIRL